MSKPGSQLRRCHTLRRMGCNVALWYLLLTSISVNAQIPFRPFSADQITTRGKQIQRAKICATEKAIRMEGEQKGQKSVTVLRTDRKVMWVLMPERQTYMELPFGLGGAFADLAHNLEGAKVEREPLGSEQVGEYHCDKYRVRTTYEGRVYTSIQWAAKELDGFAVKTQDEKGEYTAEYQSVRLGPQDPLLFESPPGYQKLGIP